MAGVEPASGEVGYLSFYMLRLFGWSRRQAMNSQTAVRSAFGLF